MSIRLEHVDHRYPSGVAALLGVQLRIGSAEAVALVGANGSGKSTLARHLVGLLRPDSGTIHIGDRDATSLTVAELARLIGLAFQDPDRQIFGRTVRAEVEFGPRNLGQAPDVRARSVEQALRATGLEDAAEAHPQDLGDARRKLLSIASVLAMQTPVVVLDEPTTGLDRRDVARVESIISDVHKAGRTVIGISHDMRFVAESFERIVLLEAGRVVLDAAVGDAFAEAAWPLLRSAGLAPPAAAVAGVRMGLGATPTEAALLQALAGSRGTRRADAG